MYKITMIKLLAIFFIPFVLYGCGGSGNAEKVQEETINTVVKTGNHIDKTGEGFYTEKSKERPTKYITITTKSILKLNKNDDLTISDSYGKKHKFKITSKESLKNGKYYYKGNLFNKNGKIFNDLNIDIYISDNSFICSFSISDGTSYNCYTQNINGVNYGIVTKTDDPIYGGAASLYFD